MRYCVSIKVFNILRKPIEKLIIDYEGKTIELYPLASKVC